jgi:hypothetical protein
MTENFGRNLTLVRSMTLSCCEKCLMNKEQLKELITRDECLALNLELWEHIKKADGGSGIRHIGQEA